jgi:hypothetical protein
MNELTRKTHPEIFVNIQDAITKDSSVTHRRSSNFYVNSIVEFREEDAKYYPTISNFSDFIGTWMTNTYIRDDNHGTDFNEIDRLTRVKRVLVMIPTETWQVVE